MSSRDARAPRTVSRRHLLRGAAGGLAAAVALPPLDVMFDGNGAAYADGTPIPKRFGVWFWGNGVRMEHWVPRTQGPGYQLSTSLRPLEAHRPWLTVVSGTAVKPTGTVHHVGRAVMLTGAYQPPPPGASCCGEVAGVSADQIVARAWAKQTRFDSLQLGVSTINRGGGTSWSGPKTPMSAEYSPAALFARLFGGAAGTSRRGVVQTKVIDLVRGDATALRARLGRGDQRRIDAHLAAIDDLERAIAAAPKDVCMVPAAPVDPKIESVRKEPLEERNRLLSELLALALACDVTRVFSVEYSSMQGDTFFWQVGAVNGMHTMTHDDSRTAASFTQHEKVQAATVFTMGALNTLLAKLAAVKEGAGTLLDSCLLIATTECGDGTVHTTNDMPVLLAGKAGGALKAGAHHRFNGESSSKIHMTCFRALGVPVNAFGAGAGAATEPLPGLLA